jgi:hypothetical protein
MLVALATPEEPGGRGAFEPDPLAWLTVIGPSTPVPPVQVHWVLYSGPGCQGPPGVGR